ncbi:MAG TPA: hypothetical protein VFS11_04620 [Gemmatimonadales bacterium]|nr:hypothetical protein [Gemmatimonadales bacterium]
MAVAVAAGLILACSPQPTEPTAPGPPPPGGNGSGATAPTPPPSTAPSPLIGSWRGVITAFAPTIQTVTWRFSGDGTCLQTFVTITSDGMGGGTQFTSDRPCVWTADASQVTITYAGGAGPVVTTLPFSFPAANVLRLGADEFDRVA